MRTIWAALAFLTIAAACLSKSAEATSSINPNVPAANSPLASAPIRGNFLNAYNDINALQSMSYGPTAPNSPSPMQSWANSAGYPNIVLNYWSVVTSSWVPYENVNVSTDVASPYLASGGSLAATAPITANFSAGAATLGINLAAPLQTIAGSLTLPGLPLYNVQMRYGATGNGTSDDTPAINTAIAAINAAGVGTLYLPCGKYNVTGSGASVFTAITGIMRVLGEGACSQIVLNASIPNTRDLFHYIGSSPNVLSGITASDFAIVDASTPAGRHLFHFDCSAATGLAGNSEFHNVVIARVTTTVLPIATYPPLPVNAAGHVIFIDNASGANANGCVDLATIDHDMFAAPVGFQDFYCEECGDSLHLFDSQLSGPGGAIYSDQIAGAGNLIIGPGNSITAAGMVQIAAGYKPQVISNEFEQPPGANTEANGALVDIDGSIAAINYALVWGNQITVLSGVTGVVSVVRNNVSNSAFADANVIATGISATKILNTASAAGLVFGAANILGGAGANFTDLGSGTAQVLTSLTAPALVGVTVPNYNFNPASPPTDTAVPVTGRCPSSYSRYVLNSVRINGASASLTTSTIGVYTSPSAGGVAIDATQAVTVSTSADGTNNNAQALTPSASNTTLDLSFASFGTLYIHQVAAEGSAATGNIEFILVCMP
jgi:hypothetical protein